MPVAAVSERDFTEEVLASDVPVLVVFSADRCIPCQHMTPALGVLGREMAGKIKLFKIDADREADIKAEYGVHALPTLVLFKSGRAVARRVGAIIKKEALQEWINVELIQAIASSRAAQLPRASGFKLSNGLDVVVISDHRAPFVNHALWYRVGAADEPEGFSGIARLVEHLMFKSRDKLSDDQFSKTISSLGGTDSARDYRDATVFEERVSSTQLRAVMELEAARMADLRLARGDVRREREIVSEVRRCRADLPLQRLVEKMDAALYQEHPYGVLNVGRANEIARLSQKDVIRFHKQHYAPNNAVLAVYGDVTPDEVRVLAEATYGLVPPNPDVRPRQRPAGPEILAPRRVIHREPRLGAALLRRSYLVPSCSTGEPGEAEALTLLMAILCKPAPGRLQSKLEFEMELATSVSGGYSDLVVDTASFWVSAYLREEHLAAAEDAIDVVLEDIRTNGTTELELARAKKSVLTSYIYSWGDPLALTGRYGYGLAIGRTASQLENWPQVIARVSVEDVVRVANAYLVPERSVTGWLLPGADDPDSER